MPFDFAAAKLSVRRIVHATFGVQAFYQDDSMDAAVECKVRLHSKMSKPLGNLFDGAGYAEVNDGIDRIVFQTPTVYLLEDGTEVPFTPVRNAVITFPGMIAGMNFTLDIREPATGPAEEIWQVTREL